MKLRWPHLLLLGAGGAAGAVLLVRRFEHDFIFWPLRSLKGTPADFHADYETLTLHPTSDLRIHGWFLPHPAPRAVVLYLQGNGGNRSHRLGHLRMLHELGCSVLIVDYEGYGESEGRASETAVYRDARAALDWLAADPRTRDLPLVLHGESLGGAVASQMARERAPDGLILDHTFTTMGEMIHRVARVPLHRVCSSQYRSIDNLQHYHGPVLVIHGELDRLIPIEQGRRLYEAANPPKTFLAIEGASHDLQAVLEMGGEKYRKVIGELVEQAVEERDRRKGETQ